MSLRAFEAFRGLSIFAPHGKQSPEQNMQHQEADKRFERDLSRRSGLFVPPPTLLFSIQSA